jgi:hypothetical protein
MGELGVAVKDGKITFSPGILNKDEFLKAPATFTYVDINYRPQQIALEKNSICFTYCQVPVVYKLADEEGLEVIFKAGPSVSSDTLQLDRATSELVFERAGEVAQIDVSLRK